MTPADLIRRERVALEELTAAPEGQAVLEAHRRWLDARRGIQAHLGREHGLPLIHHTPKGELVYSLKAGRLYTTTSPQGG